MPLPSSGVITIAQIAAEFGGVAPHDLSEYYKGGLYVKATDTAPNVPASGQISLSNFYGAAKSIAGQIEFTTTGIYNWIVPAGVTSVCVVAVGGNNTSQGSGGWSGQPASGASLAWGNNIPVTPGQSCEVRVGGVDGIPGQGFVPQSSYFINTNVLFAGGGAGTTQNGIAQANGGAYLGGGGLGGSCNTASEDPAGGGGTGGYTGNGGRGGSDSNEPTAGQGGGGGGGYRGTGINNYRPGGGGGTGLLGQGSSGAPGQIQEDLTGGYGGSKGGSGEHPNGGTFGGGSAGATGTGYSGRGAVRIIWGAGRAFPSTNTGNV